MALKDGFTKLAEVFHRIPEKLELDRSPKFSRIITEADFEKINVTEKDFEKIKASNSINEAKIDNEKFNVTEKDFEKINTDSGIENIKPQEIVYDELPPFAEKREILPENTGEVKLLPETAKKVIEIFKTPEYMEKGFGYGVENFDDTVLLSYSGYEDPYPVIKNTVSNEFVQERAASMTADEKEAFLNMEFTFGGGDTLEDIFLYTALAEERTVRNKALERAERAQAIQDRALERAAGMTADEKTAFLNNAEFTIGGGASPEDAALYDILAEQERIANENKHIQSYSNISQVNENIIKDIDSRNIASYFPDNAVNEAESKRTKGESVSADKDAASKSTAENAAVLENNESDIMKMLFRMSNLGEPAAQNMLGICYMTGLNVSVNKNYAVELFEKAAESGFAAAERNLAIALQFGDMPNMHKAVEMYERAAEKNDSFAQNNLAACYLTGNGVEKDVRKAIQLLEKAVKSGDDFAMVNLADCYAVGNGVRKNDKKAFNLYIQAADMGNTAAIRNVADCYYNGIGTEQSFETALRYYKLAADDGDLESQQIYAKIKDKITPYQHFDVKVPDNEALENKAKAIAEEADAPKSKEDAKEKNEKAEQKKDNEKEEPKKKIKEKSGRDER